MPKKKAPESPPAETPSEPAPQAASARERAAERGLLVPEDWTDDQINKALAVYDDIEASGPPPAQVEWEPASPRG